jgi:hypothetical protein
MAACLAVGGSFAIGRRLAARRRVDRVAVSVCLAIVLPLAVVAAVGFATRPPSLADRELESPSVPYTFKYPGSWRQDSPRDVPQVPGERWVTAVSKQTDGDVKQGLIVVATDDVSPDRLLNWMLSSDQGGAHIVAKRRTSVAGYPALTVEYERAPGRGFRSRTGMFVGGTAFVFTCVLEEEPEQARAGCDKVLDTFAIKGDSPFEDSGAPPAARLD